MGLFFSPKAKITQIHWTAQEGQRALLFARCFHPCRDLAQHGNENRQAQETIFRKNSTAFWRNLPKQAAKFHGWRRQAG